MPPTEDSHFVPYDRLTHLSGVLYCILLCLVVFFPETGYLHDHYDIHVVYPILAFLSSIPALSVYLHSRPDWKQALLLGSLPVLLLVSGWLALPDADPLNRAMAVTATGLCGFMGGMLLFNEDRLFRILMYALALILAAYLAICFWAVATTGRANYPFVDIHKHVQLTFLFSLSLGPLYLALARRGPVRWLCVLLLGAAYASLYFMNARFGMALPLVLLPLLAVLTRLSFKHIVAIALAGILLCGVAYRTNDSFKLLLQTREESICYRAEGYLFSLHVLSASPRNMLFGKGMRADMTGYLEDYTPSFPDLTKARYTRQMNRLHSFDNIYLSILADVGLPFFLLYFGAMAIPVFRGVLACRQKRPPREVMALTIIICAMLIHFIIYEGLYNAPVSYLFHLPLGLLVARTSRAYAGTGT